MDSCLRSLREIESKNNLAIRASEEEIDKKIREYSQRPHR